MSAGEAKSQVSKPLLIALAVTVVGALVVLVVLPMLSGGDADVDLAAPASAPTSAPAPEPVPTPSTVPSDGEDAADTPPPETFEVFSARDPFSQLVAPDSAEDAATQAPTATAPPPAPDPNATVPTEAAPAPAPTVAPSPSATPTDTAIGVSPAVPAPASTG